jgi:hypothetical protein
LSAWVASHTDLSSAEVVSLGPAGAVAVSVAPPAARGGRVTLRIETLDRELAAQDGAVSWASSAEVDCKARRLRFGAAWGYGRRSAQGAAVVSTPAETAWRDAVEGQPSGAIWRAVCVAPARPAARPPTAGGPSPAGPRAIDRAVKAQVAALPSQPEAENFRARFRREHRELVADKTLEIEAGAGGRVFRVLISGFGGPGEARRACAALVAAGQACFVRAGRR